MAIDREALEGIPTPGEVLDEKYEIERVLGAGGMGVVVAGKHTGLGQRVAIKFLLPDVMRKQPEAAERFLREARAAINLRSEHIARVTDVGKSKAGAPYMVMEYLEGQDLQQLLREKKPLRISSVIDYVLQAGEALAEAHAVGIVHRDLKPANLFLTRRADDSPLVKVLDFGISKAVASTDRGITRTDAVMGSPGYMSPEQIRSAKHVDQRADVWGMGVILYELLASVPPFSGDNIATLSAQIVLETPKPVHLIRTEIPKTLSDIVQRCLEKEPERRFQNMAELAEALRPFADPSSGAIVERIKRITRSSLPLAETVNITGGSAAQSSAPTINTWEQTKSAAQRKRTVLLALAAVVSVISILVVVFLAGRKSAQPTAEPADSERSQAATNPKPSVAAPEPSAAPPTSAKQPSPALNPPPAETSSRTSAAPSTTAAPVAKPARARPPVAAKQRPPQCPAGQAVSHGHCCPVGLVWQNGRCDRPLATALP